MTTRQTIALLRQYESRNVTFMDPDGAERIGASVIPMSSGNTDKQIMIMQDYRSSALVCTPSYALTIADRLGASRTYEFIDGGVSTFGNPSFQLFLEATEPQYRLGWQTGPDNLLLVSVGNGLAGNRLPLGAVRRLPRYYQAAMTSCRPSRLASLPSLGSTSAFTRSFRSSTDECAAEAWSW